MLLSWNVELVKSKVCSMSATYYSFATCPTECDRK